MTMIDPVQFGRLEARVEAVSTRIDSVDRSVQAIDTKLDTVLNTLAEKRGERRMATAVAGFGGSLLGILFGWLAK